MKTAIDKHIEAVRAAADMDEFKQRIHVSLLEKPNRQFETCVFWPTNIRERYIGAVNC